SSSRSALTRKRVSTMCATPTNKPLPCAAPRTQLARRRPTALAALALLAVLGAGFLTPLPAADPAEKPALTKVEDKFRSGGKDVIVERFAPAAEGKYPALVVLHAVDGIEGDAAELYRKAALSYAEQQYVVLLVHYFDRTGNTAADVKRYRALFVNHFTQKDP